MALISCLDYNKLLTSSKHCSNIWIVAAMSLGAAETKFKHHQHIYEGYPESLCNYSAQFLFEEEFL
jgi:hypothetical protein